LCLFLVITIVITRYAACEFYNLQTGKPLSMDTYVEDHKTAFAEHTKGAELKIEKLSLKKVDSDNLGAIEPTVYKCEQHRKLSRKVVKGGNKDDTGKDAAEEHEIIDMGTFTLK
jgi:hypothetical protein